MANTGKKLLVGGLLLGLGGLVARALLGKKEEKPKPPLPPGEENVTVGISGIKLIRVG